MIKADKILWATDGSKEARYALSYSKLIAKTLGSEIIGLHVIKSIDKRLWGLLSKRRDLTVWPEDAANNWFNIFSGIQEELNKEKSKFTYKVVTGLPHEKILEVADQEKADLIVMGKRGVGLKDRILVGSNTVKVLQRSEIPVLAVKRKGEKSLPRIKKILVPFDVSEKFDSALRYAYSLGKTLDANILVLYVLELISYPYEFPLHILNEMREVYKKELNDKIVEISSQYGNKLKIRHKVTESINSYLGIIGVAETEKIDLIVMNTHGRRGVKRLAMGSVAEKVIQEAPCSILALKPSK